MKEVGQGEKEGEGGRETQNPGALEAAGGRRGCPGPTAAKRRAKIPGLKARLGSPQAGGLKGWMKKLFSDVSILFGPQKGELSVRHPCSTQAAEPTLKSAEGCPQQGLPHASLPASHRRKPFLGVGPEFCR